MKNITKISIAAKRMQHLVDDILSYSLLEDKKSTVSPVDLNVVLQEILDEYQDEIQQHRVSMEIGKLPTVPAISYKLLTPILFLHMNFGHVDVEKE